MIYLINQYDGGGILGVIFTTCMRLIKEEFGLDLAKSAHMHAGSSTGGISGSAYACGTSPKDVDDLYVKKGPSLFKKINRLWPPTNLLKPEYDYRPILDQISELLIKEGFVQPVKLGDLKKDFMCTSVSLMDERTHFFKSWDDADKSRNLIDCIRATYAAAFYFGKFTDSIRQEVWADGGEGQDNCSLRQCWMEALLRGWMEAGNSVKVLSFGCGYVKGGRTFQQASSLSMPEEVLLYPTLARRQSVADQLFEAKTLRGKLPIDVLRLDVELSKGYSLDAVNHIRDFVAAGKRMFDNNKIKIKQFLSL